MARLRVQLILNEGGEGIPLNQLASISGEAEKFVRYLAVDAGITVTTTDLIARHFENKSVRFDIEDDGDHQSDDIKGFNARLAFVAEFKSPATSGVGAAPVRHQTMLQFAKMADALAGHEKLSFGMYHPNDDKPYSYRPLTKSDAANLHAALTETVTYTGTLQGTVHTISVAEAWFHFRPGPSAKLVRCIYSDDQYNALHSATERRNGLVYVRGTICARRYDREVQSVKVSSIRAAPRLSNERYESFFGFDENYTGSLTTDQFIEAVREHE